MKPRKNNQKQSRAPLPWRAAGCVVVMFCAGMLLLGATGPDETEQNSRKKIESMSPAERAQLKRNYEKFQKLTPEEKARYRKIHDAIRKKPELNHVMRCYEDWVRTLSPWEQEDLRKARTPEERMALIRKFRAEHKNSGRWKRYRNYFEVMKILGFEWGDRGKDNRDPGWRVMMRMQAPTPELFQQVIGTIEKSLPEPVSYSKPKAELTEFQRSLAVLRAAAEVKQRDKQKGSDWPPPEVVQSVSELIDKDQYHFFRDIGERRGDAVRRSRLNLINPDLQRVMITGFLARGIIHELIISVRDELDQITVPEAQLQKFFETLGSKDKDDLLKHPPEELQERLKFMYLKEHLVEQNRAEFADRAREVRQLAVSLIRGGDLEGAFRGPRGRFQNQNDRRPNGPAGRGNRDFRGRPLDRNPDNNRPRPAPGKPDA
ncbi:hypothetical protein Pan153_62960 [Gimesia panareensis]|uniref:DUF3106 domain-containing protein n=1 Tax=Gimesia panareensis TaxID=2527978 RepID=A0A518FZ66_9PLAN|nr:hypothetical protein [Gimesia panareensis]QDV21606.1 hypothetical protein Pan153_62960 [Gimesia panareensis]